MLVEKMNARALGLKRKGMDEEKEKKAWVEMKRPFFFIEAMKLCAFPLPRKTCSFPTHRDWWRGGITHNRIDGNPAIRGHDLCFDKTCQGNCLAICVVAG